MNYIILLLLGLGIVGCYSFSHSGINYINLADRLSIRFVRQVYQTDGLLVYGEGGAMMGDIQKISLYFEKIQNINLSEARILTVKLIEEYLSMVNKELSIRPYLHDYPFTVKNLHFSVSFYKSDGKLAGYPYINDILIAKGKVYYSAFDTEGFYIEPTFSEPYEETVRIVDDSFSNFEELIND